MRGESAPEASFCHRCGTLLPKAERGEGGGAVLAAGAIADALDGRGWALSTQEAQRPEAAKGPADSVAAPLPARPVGPAIRRWPSRVAVALSGLLSVALVVVAVAARSQLDQRDASLLSAQRAIDDLTVANLALQDGVRELGEERERLLAQVAELEQRSAELGSALADTRRQLEQARQESSQQQSRAQSAEARSTALARVVQLDEEIHREFVLFLQEYDALYRALVRYDVLGAQAAYSRAKRAADRLLDLFDQRRAAMARL